MRCTCGILLGTILVAVGRQERVGDCGWGGSHDDMREQIRRGNR